MGDSRFVSALFGARLIQTASARGLDARALWRAIGTSPQAVERDPRLPIEEERHLALWERVMRQARDPGVPIDYARSTSIDSYGLLGLACKTAPNVEAALRVVTRFVGLYASNVGVRVARRKGGAAVVLESPGPLRLGRRCQIESGLAEIWIAIKDIVGRGEVSCAATFAHRSPGDTGAHAELFGMAPTFSAPQSALLLEEPLLRQSLLRSDRALHAHLVGTLESMARSVPPQMATSERARRAVFQLLPEAPRVGTVARLLGVSERTLQRRLSSENTTFDEVADGARRDVADALLGDARVTLAEVAAATGFSEASAFSRAYKRWTRRSPRQSRRRS